MSLAFDIGQEFKLGGQTGIGGATGYRSIGQLISVILPNVYVIAGVILFLIFVFWGIRYLTSGGNPEETAKANKAITTALIGFVIVFASYWLIQIVQIITGLNILGGGGL